MKREAITLPDYGAKHGTLASHRWLAGNTAVPFYYGFDEQLDEDHRVSEERQLSQRRSLCAEGWRQLELDDRSARHNALHAETGR